MEVTCTSAVHVTQNYARNKYWLSANSVLLAVRRHTLCTGNICTVHAAVSM